MSLLQLGIELFLIVQKVFSYLMLLRESLPHALCLRVPEPSPSKASDLQGCEHMVRSGVVALVILGCEPLRRSPRRNRWPQQGTQTPGKGCWHFSPLYAAIHSVPKCSWWRACSLSSPASQVGSQPS